MRSVIGKYVIGQILGPFGMFSLIFLGVVWLTQSLQVIETVVSSGQSAAIFAEFTLLLLPAVMSMVLPVAAFAGALYAVNRLFLESELVVMLAAGMSPLRLARHVATFGALVMAAMFVITLQLAPAASREMRERIATLQADLAGALLREGQFLHPAKGVTVYIRRVDGAGRMAGLFVQDDRDPEARVTYTAEGAALIRTEDGPRLVMFNGAAQRLTPGEKELTVLGFERLVYDLGQLADRAQERRRKPSEYPAWELVAPSAEVLQGRPPHKFVAEGHEQLSAPLYAVALPLVGLAALLGPGWRRRGYGKRLAAALALAAATRLAGVAAKSAVSGQADLWPLMYAPPILATALALAALSRGLPRPRGAAARGAEAGGEA
ncbi:LPS export ABC transporter permease LptF [Oceanicella actignis]|uniref:Lipopolysaccharide export system permease protein n=1 Tax=Oceanicella actignis TaxID=1189325 RepID=A0A1M7RZ44_9RHOB|nr:LPS export ABC transporter permease LptF [Oceanicella actignis]TYO90030.1 lipopolysaccharide export system permease protein [Oceanicella actignis]SES96805.1 lipopolysaccharide export system permease protein [Oceanicella actignis]SHN51332.1 lipopolysaccharide export system permease protein [Oceanicella actignis]